MSFRRHSKSKFYYFFSKSKLKQKKKNKTTQCLQNVLVSHFYCLIMSTHNIKESWLKGYNNVLWLKGKTGILNP